MNFKRNRKINSIIGICIVFIVTMALSCKVCYQLSSKNFVRMTLQINSSIDSGLISLLVVALQSYLVSYYYETLEILFFFKNKHSNTLLDYCKAATITL